MPDWTAPFKLPTFTDDKFIKEKAKYVAKHGYTITVPGLSDIIKIGIEEPMTIREKAWWRAKYYDKFSPERRERIAEMKQRRKERYLAMLASPTPQIGTNIGSFMTAFDDAQDALGTIAVVGRMAMHLAPRIMRRAFAGPLSWLMGTADLLNLMRHLQCVGFPGKAKKRMAARLTDANPFTKKARLLRAARLKRILPTKGEIIEGLQTTGEVFGYGISLGPIVGLAQDLAMGFARLQRGERVKIDLPIPGSVERAQNAWKATTSYKKWSEFDKDPDYSLAKGMYGAALKFAKSAGLFFGGAHHSDDEDILQMFAGSYLSAQALMPVQDMYNPASEMDRVAEIEVHAPVPTNILTLEVIEEAGDSVEDIVGWPHNGSRWATIEELSDNIQPVAYDNLKRYVTRQQYTWNGYTAGYLASEQALYTLGCLEGEENVEYDYTAPAHALVQLMDRGYKFHPETKPGMIDILATYLDWWELQGIHVTIGELMLLLRRSGIRVYRGRKPPR